MQSNEQTIKESDMYKNISILLIDAGNLLLEKQADNKVSTKYEHYDIASIVSEADIAAEALIIERLEKLYPEFNIFSEEKGLIDKGSSKTWYIDPLDGTSNYTRGIPIWGVSIGLIDSGEPVFGTIILPKVGDMFYAEKGIGAFRNSKRITVSKRPLNQALFYGRGYFKGKLALDTNIGEKVGITKVLDCSCFELSEIALGNGEIYSLFNVPHDVVAGIVLVTEAGGKVSDSDGNPWKLDSKWIVATNGIVHEDVLKIHNSTKPF